MGWIIFFGIWALLIWSALKHKNISKETEIKIKRTESNLIYHDVLDYMGGFDDVIGSTYKKCHIYVFNDILRFRLTKIGGFDEDIFKDIPYKDVVSVKIVSEKYISEQLSLGKLVCFGLLSLGMKKNSKSKVDEYLVITIKYNNEDISIVLDREFNKENMIELLNQIRKQIK